MSEQPLRILGLSGEYRPTSKSGMMVNHALDIASNEGAEIFFWELNKMLEVHDRRSKYAWI